jgi:cysteine-rich repeat protein
VLAVVGRSYLVLCVLLLTACLKDSVVPCSDGRICPADMACDTAHHGCVLPAQLEGCEGEPDGTHCTYRGVPRGACYEQVCLPAGCGNGILDAEEVCDDKNRLHGDGCSADCRSNETCGNKKVDVALGEACDVGPAPSAWCRADCSAVTCGDGKLDVDAFEECDDGANNSTAPNARCRPNCQARRCGDRIVDESEVCDDGNVVSGDGCAAGCDSNETCGNGVVDVTVGESCEPNESNRDSCRIDCVSVRCGDGIVDVGAFERCDEGASNSSAPDAACRQNCQPRRCGDGVLDSDEVCDDGNTRGRDGCSADCTSNETCGNGVVDVLVGESCEPDDTNREWCRPNCVTVRCGDGVLDALELCDEGASNSSAPDATCRPDCQPGRCGDRVKDGDEACDDGNTVNNDGCSYDCRSTERCGNGYTDLSAGEECDDANWLSHDGCSSSCQRESPARRLLLGSNGVFPPDAALVFDAAREAVVLCAGGSVYELHRSSWRALTPRRAPRARTSFSYVWDAGRRRTLLFGGKDSLDRLVNETWEWDGVKWLERTPPLGSPTPRTGAVLTYDAARDRVVLFGGTGASGELSDTWAWDGSAWSEVSTSSAPPPGSHPGAYDPISGEVVLFDGSALWRLDGDSWRSESAALPFEERTDAGTPSLAFEAERGRLVYLSSGFNQEDEYYVLLEWDGAAWQQFPTVRRPRMQPEGQLLYHATRRRLMLRGGPAVWEWAGSAWEQRDAEIEQPKLRAYSALAYDAGRATAVLFGGADFSSTHQDTWLWDGDSWLLASTPTTPPARMGHALAYDARAEQVVMFGGGTDSYEVLGDTWLWDGEDWTQASPAVSPPARMNHAMAYDAAGQRVVLFGGVEPGTGLHLGDLWTWDGSTWTEHPLTGAPSPRAGHAMSYDPVRREVVVDGWTDDWSSPPGDASTWAWDGAGWLLVSELGPESSAYPALFYDPNRRETVSTGGGDNDRLYAYALSAQPASGEARDWREIAGDVAAGPTVLGPQAVYEPLRGRALILGIDLDGESSQTWELRHESEGALDEACASGGDYDGDGLAGCADPDCWGHCTPLCPPGAECAPELARCGDGVCNAALETCRLCPQDCACEPLCGDFVCDSGESAESCAGDCR